MWPFIALEAYNVARVPPPSPPRYPDGSNLRLLCGTRDEWLPVRAEGPHAPLRYAVASASARLPPGLKLDRSTGTISGACDLEVETGNRCQIHEIDVEATDPWGRKQSGNVRLHLYPEKCGPEIRPYSSAYAVSSPPSANLDANRHREPFPLSL